MTALIAAVIEARPLGLTHPIVVAGSLLALGAGAAFLAVEALTTFPMLPLYFFRLQGFTPAIAFGVLVNCTYYGIIFVLSLYLRKALGYSTVQAGLTFLPLTGTFIASNLASGWLAGRVRLSRADDPWWAHRRRRIRPASSIREPFNIHRDVAGVSFYLDNDPPSALILPRET